MAVSKKCLNKYIECAIDLGYSRDVIAELRDAETEDELCRIMCNARLSNRRIYNHAKRFVKEN